METVLDASVPRQARLHAAWRPGPDTADPAARARAIATPGGPPRILAVGTDGGRRDPGQRVIQSDELGGIALLTGLAVPGDEPPADVSAA